MPALDPAHDAALAGASVIRCIEGFGVSRRVRSSRALSLAENLPAMILIIDTTTGSTRRHRKRHRPRLLDELHRSLIDWSRRWSPPGKVFRTAETLMAPASEGVADVP